MSTPDVTATLTFWNGEEPPRSEADFAAFMVAEVASRPAVDEQGGTLTIQSGEVSVAVGDLLHIMMSNFCLLAVGEVIKSGEGSFLGWLSEDTFTLKRVGDDVEVASEYQDTARFPLRPFAQALHAAASRYIAMVTLFWDEDEMAQLDKWREMAGQTKALIDAMA